MRTTGELLEKQAAALPWVTGIQARFQWVNQALQFMVKKPLGAAGGLVLLGLVLVAVFAEAIAPYDPLLQDVPHRLSSPGGAYWFGTDVYGRDIFSRIVFGARVSLYVGLLSTLIGTISGTVLGVASGFLGGKFDLAMQRVVDALMGIPGLVLALVMVVALGASLNSVTFAVAIGFIPRVIRLARSSTLSVKEEMYTMAAQAIGCTTLRVMLRHVMPNTLASIFVLATGYLGTAIVAEASLSFLGLGIPPPHPSWGGMLQFGARGYLETAPWLTLFPGFALSIVVFAFALFGDALRDVLDPRLRGR